MTNLTWQGDAGEYELAPLGIVVNVTFKKGGPLGSTVGTIPFGCATLLANPPFWFSPDDARKLEQALERIKDDAQ